MNQLEGNMQMKSNQILSEKELQLQAYTQDIQN